MMDLRLEKTIHQIQGQLITLTNKSWSESKILNLLLYISVCHPNEFNSFELKRPILDFLNGGTLEFNQDMIKKMLQIIEDDNL